MAVVCLQALSQMLVLLPNQRTNETKVLSNKADRLAREINQGISEYGVRTHPKYGNIYGYEVDGFGSVNFMDDANVPSLLSLPYLGYCKKNDSLYLATRKFVLSVANPYYSLIGFSSGSIKGGVGGPHIGTPYFFLSLFCFSFFSRSHFFLKKCSLKGRGWVWPMSLIVQGLTSQSDDEIKDLLQLLTTISINTNGFIHESFWKDNYQSYTRPWFAWANSIFGEFVLTVAAERPYLIFN